MPPHWHSPRKSLTQFSPHSFIFTNQINYHVLLAYYQRNLQLHEFRQRKKTFKLQSTPKLNKITHFKKLTSLAMLPEEDASALDAPPAALWAPPASAAAAAPPAVGLSVFVSIPVPIAALIAFLVVLPLLDSLMLELATSTVIEPEDAPAISHSPPTPYKSP